MYESFLPLVEKPARYINQEVNAVHKDPRTVRTAVCLLFPDTYEVGMSHLGLRILYDIINRRDDALCERVFSPWKDYEERLRQSGSPLKSIESNKPLAEFDFLGVTLQYELSYTNVLGALDLAGIPLRSRDRIDGHPVVLAGGPCCVNPAPLSEFIDVFFIGEAEEAIHELIDLRQRSTGRTAFLESAAGIDGCYVPAMGARTVRRRRIADIDAAPYPSRPILPLMKPVHDRVTAEIARGCIRGCRFCQAGIIYRPYRERSSATIRSILASSLACTGYEELSLASLSSGDHSEIEPLVTGLMEQYRDSRVSVSLPSLRIGTLTPAMIEAIAETRKTGFNLAPEAGTERLRRVINKPVSDQDLLEAAETIFANGWSVIKLYFMIGLPTETDRDLDGIVQLANELFAAGKRTSRRHVQINISVSTFVPKPHTPFQWFGQCPPAEIRRKQDYLASRLRKRGISLKPHDPGMSVLEAAFARGSSSLGTVIEKAVALGCRMDGWTECFDFAKWQEAFAASGVDLQKEAGRSYDLDAELPWDFVRTGATKAFLKQEYGKAMAAEVTGNCREECTHCGIGCPNGGTAALGKPAPASDTAPAPPPSPAKPAPSAPELSTRIRMRFWKTGRIRFLSHLDLMVLFHRTASRAGVPLAYSQGFNPHPKVSFGPPLSVGLESTAEYVDMETDPFVDLSRITEELNRSLPEGLRIEESRIVPKKTPSLSGSIARYRYHVEPPSGLAHRMPGIIRDLLDKSSVVIVRDRKAKEIRPGIESIIVKSDSSQAVLEITLVDTDQSKPRIQDVVQQLFGMTREEISLLKIRRTAMFVRENGSWADPLEADQ